MNINKNSVLVAVTVLAVLVAGIVVLANSSYGNKLAFLGLGSSNQALAQKAIDYINAKKDQLTEGQTVSLGNVSQESGLVKFEVLVGSNTISSYVSKDGKLLFPSAIPLNP